MLLEQVVPRMFFVRNKINKGTSACVNIHMLLGLSLKMYVKVLQTNNKIYIQSRLLQREISFRESSETLNR